MSLNIQNNAVMQQTQLTFKANKACNLSNVSKDSISSLRQMLIDGLPPYLVKREEKEIIQRGINAVDKLGFELPRKIYLDQLKRTNPVMYKHVMINELEHKVMSMSNWEIIKTVFKGIFKIK